MKIIYNHEWDETKLDYSPMTAKEKAKRIAYITSKEEMPDGKPGIPAFSKSRGIAGVLR